MELTADVQALRNQQHAITMTFEHVLGGIVALALLCYLTYVLLRPERF